MNSKNIVAIKDEDVGHICMKCLKRTDDLKKIYINDLGYGSIFDGHNLKIHLCHDCYKDSSPKMWSMSVKGSDEESCYVHENEMHDYIYSLPLESQEIIFNRLDRGSSASWTMDSQDWIDYKLGELPHEKCKEYGRYSNEEIAAYRERFPTCEYPYNVIHNDGSRGCHCPINRVLGEYGQEYDRRNVWEGCYKCKSYHKRVSPIKTIKPEDEEDYKLFVRHNLFSDTLNEKFQNI